MRIVLIFFFVSFIGSKAFCQSDLPSESVYLHVDKDTYLPGEILWFKAYTVSSEELIPVSYSSTVHIDLVNAEGAIVYQSKVEIGENRSNAGSIYVPLSLNTGLYRLEAYTQLSKGNAQVFSKDIRILNPFAINEPPIATGGKDLNIAFFPEGGALVNGLQSKVGFKITDSYGKGLKADVSIFKNDLTKVGVYASNHLGVGSFTFSPLEGEVFKGVITHNGEDYVMALPKTQNEGFVLRAEKTEIGYKVSVFGTYDKINSKLVLQFGKRSKEIILNSSAKAEAIIGKEELPVGTSRLTLFNAQNEPLAERILYKAPLKTVDLDLKVDKSSFSTREKVEISLPDLSQIVVSPEVSVAVIKLDDIQRAPEENLLSYLYLSKDLKGKIENPKHYIKNDGDLDNLLLTQGWRKFIKKETDAEGRYQSVKIRYTSKTDGRPFVSQEVLLSVPDKTSIIYSAVTDENGVARFWIKNIYGNRQLATKLVSGELSHIEVQNRDLDKERDETRSLDLSKISQESYDAYGINVQVQNTFFAKERAQFMTAASADSLSFYGKSDYKYALDDYTRFVLMEEVLREYVKPVNVRKSRDNYSLRVLDDTRGMYFSTDPMILLDGIAVSNANEILNYDPLKISKIEVVASKYFFGEKIYDGIVSISTYKGNLQDFTLDPSYSVFAYEGLQLEREYYSPVLEKESRLPDNRTVLYWNPSLKITDSLKSHFSFNTSDISGKYLIDVQGIDKNGVTISGQGEFMVKD